MFFDAGGMQLLIFACSKMGKRHAVNRRLYAANQCSHEVACSTFYFYSFFISLKMRKKENNYSCNALFYCMTAYAFLLLKKGGGEKWRATEI